MADALRRRHPASLRRRILRLVTLSTILTWGLATALGYRQALVDVQELMDGQMAETARLLLAQAQHSTNHLTDLPADMASVRGTKARRGELALEFQIFRSGGSVLMRSARAPALPLDDGLSYADVAEGGTDWRSLTLETADPCRKQPPGRRPGMRPVETGGYRTPSEHRQYGTCPGAGFWPEAGRPGIFRGP